VATATAVITQPTQLTATATVKNVSCHGLNDASATVAAAGGTLPYTYVWNTTPAQNSAIATNLVAGTYQATVTDAKGCSVIVTTNVTEPLQLAYTISKIDVKCFGGNTGTATVALTGGTSPYFYNWNTLPVQATPTATGLIIGTYKVLLKDANNCQDSATVTINEPPLLTVTTSKTDERCFGGNTAIAVAYPAGGVTPYSYSWNTTPVQTTDTVKNLFAGAYIITVTDSNGCVATAKTDTITQPMKLWMKLVADKKTCEGTNTGQATTYPNGGVYPYTVLWHTTPAQKTFVATKLPAGYNAVTVTDANGCELTDSIAIENFVSPVVQASPDERICLGDTAMLAASGAKTYRWLPTTGLSCSSCQSPRASPLTSTIYTVIGTDTNQCTDTVQLPVVVIQHAEVSVASPVVNVCIGDSVQLGAYGGVGYKWFPARAVTDSTAPEPRSFTDTPAVYTVVITENECFEDTLQQQVKLHPRPTIDLGPDTRGVPGATLQLKAVVTNVADIKWQPETGLSCYNCPEPKAELTKSITYTVTANSGVCEAKDELNIKVACDDALFYMPNTFTPNNDGLNDRFWPIADGVHIVNRFRIYSRGGELVFEANNIPPNDSVYGWDGRHNQMDVQPDAFIYFLETKCSNGETIFVKGDVSVVR
jgi:gliding motility-associated-like protein